MAGYEGDGFAIEFEWKETIRYWEGSRGYLLDGGWGGDPLVLDVPAPEIWDARVPEWMRGRRDEIVARLVAHSGHRVVDSPTADPAQLRWRSLTRSG